MRSEMSRAHAAAVDWKRLGSGAAVAPWQQADHSLAWLTLLAVLTLAVLTLAVLATVA